MNLPKLTALAYASGLAAFASFDLPIVWALGLTGMVANLFLMRAVYPAR